ncbi:alkaline phosphatase D family protein [Nocardia jinanensis]|uniref:Phosphodiesterase/alkaline phosphatase D n=1 Tax=Nocardia jinanensis TaxID=382504 RepID=A0A917VKJ4_9NOCA|nr:alkaline phosphatase D family protein [Nocardia jinanensis]GGK90627.1 phosphodiesterase/alkaline phosphatase D [Nocardia jinanensis]
MSGNGIVSKIGFPGALDRRTVLRAGAVTAAAAALPVTAAAAAGPVFAHGVASGDPLPDGVILWTRVTVGPEAVPGSGAGDPAAVHWEIAEDSGFTGVVAAGSLTADAESDHTVKVDVRGLDPAHDYYYRFRALGATSAIGRTRTAPADSSSPARLRFGVVSCSNWEAGYFAAYRHLAARDDLDAVVHLGDYLYEYGAESAGGRGGAVRRHEPAHEIVVLADYRIRHGQYKTDPDLMALHARVPFVCTWDDHESANNAWSGGAENHDPATEGSWADRRAASMRAYSEWMPVRIQFAAGETRIYRRLRFGTLAELSMLDLRSYRDRQPELGTRDGDDPARTMTGTRQMEWLTAGLVSGSARWQVVGNSVMIAPLAFPPLDPDTAAAVTAVFGIPREGFAPNTDQWDGYPADRRRLLQALTDRGVSDIVFLTGDIHSSWAADVPLEAARYPTGPTAGAEFVVPSVTSAGIGDLLPTPPRTGSVALEDSVRALNPHIRYTEIDSHGYGVVEIVPDLVRMDWYYVADITDAGTAVRLAAAWELPHGGRIRPAG